MKLDGHITAEILKPFEQAADGLGAVLAVEVVGTEVGVSTPSRNMWKAAVSIDAATARMAFLAPRRAGILRNCACR